MDYTRVAAAWFISTAFAQCVKYETSCMHAIKWMDYMAADMLKLNPATILKLSVTVSCFQNSHLLCSGFVRG